MKVNKPLKLSGRPVTVTAENMHEDTDFKEAAAIMHAEAERRRETKERQERGLYRRDTIPNCTLCVGVDIEGRDIVLLIPEGANARREFKLTYHDAFAEHEPVEEVCKVPAGVIRLLLYGSVL
jgi:hypothetical protein